MNIKISILLFFLFQLSHSAWAQSVTLKWFNQDGVYVDVDWTNQSSFTWRNRSFQSESILVPYFKVDVEIPGKVLNAKQSKKMTYFSRSPLFSERFSSKAHGIEVRAQTDQTHLLLHQSCIDLGVLLNEEIKDFPLFFIGVFCKETSSEVHAYVTLSEDIQFKDFDKNVRRVSFKKNQEDQFLLDLISPTQKQAKYTLAYRLKNSQTKSDQSSKQNATSPIQIRLGIGMINSINRVETQTKAHISKAIEIPNHSPLVVSAELALFQILPQFMSLPASGNYALGFRKNMAELRVFDHPLSIDLSFSIRKLHLNNQSFLSNILILPEALFLYKTSFIDTEISMGYNASSNMGPFFHSPQLGIQLIKKDFSVNVDLNFVRLISTSHHELITDIELSYVFFRL